MITSNGSPWQWLDRLEFRTGWGHRVEVGTCPYHGHDGLELVYHPVGRGETCLENGEKVEFGPGDITVTPPGLRHAQRNDEEGEDFCLVGGIATDDFPGPAHLIIRRQVKDEYVLREFRDMAAVSSGGALVRHYRLRALAATLFQAEVPTVAETGEGRYVGAAKKLLEEGYVDRRLEIRDVARKIGISADYLRHVFLAGEGIGPKQFLMQLRLSRARELLSHSTLTLKEIAALSGFDNERYLCACFRQAVGMTPGRFRAARLQ